MGNCDSCHAPLEDELNLGRNDAYRNLLSIIADASKGKNSHRTQPECAVPADEVSEPLKPSRSSNSVNRPLHYQSSPELKDWTAAISKIQERYDAVEAQFGTEIAESTIRAFLAGNPNESNVMIQDMLRKAVEWRQGLYPNVFDEKIDESIRHKVPMCIYETDGFAHPVWYVDLARYQKCNKSQADELKTFVLRALLHLRDIETHIADKVGEPGSIWEHVAVFNLKNASFWDVASMKSLICILLEISNTMFGQMTYKVFFINCGRSFTLLHSMFKPFIAQETLDNTLILGEQYIDELSKVIPLEKIPKEFGGKAEKPWVDGGIVLPSNVKYQYSSI